MVSLYRLDISLYENKKETTVDRHAKLVSEHGDVLLPNIGKHV